MEPTAEKARAPVAANKHKWPRRLGLILLLAVAVGVVVYRYNGTDSQAPRKLTLLGNIDVRQVNLAFKVGGRIESVAVDEGDAVASEQVLASLDKQYFEDDLQLARAQLEQAQANLDRLIHGSRPEEIAQANAQVANAQAALVRAEQDFSRSQVLIKQKAISSQEFDANQATFLEAQAALKSAQAARELTIIGPRVEDIAAGQAQLDAATAQIQIADRRLSDAVLVSPHDGIILTRAREAGAIVAPGETVVTLTLASPVWVRTYVGETDLGNVQPGMDVTVQTDTTAGHTYNGKVGYISPTAEFTPKSVETRELRTSLVYRLRIVVDNPDGGLRQGMPVTVAVDLPGTQPRTFLQRMREALGLNQLVGSP
jgi:HlyD family secretion protein